MIIDYDTGRPIGSWVNPAGFTAPSFSRDGRVALATSTTDDELWMWDMPSGRLRSTLAQTSLAALGTETSDAGYLLTRRADDSYLLSDTTGIPLVTLGPAGDEELDLGSALHQPTSGPIGRNSTSTGPIGGGPVLLDPRPGCWPRPCRTHRPPTPSCTSSRWPRAGCSRPSRRSR